MGVFYDKVLEFEECIYLLSKNRTTECFASMILIDSLVDSYIHKYMAGLDCAFMPPEVILENCNGSFDKRVLCLAQHNIINDSVSKSIRALHEYRNLYLHKNKEITNEIIPLANFYFYLFEELFVSIPTVSACLSDREKSRLLFELYSSHSTVCFEKNFREEIVARVNQSYQYIFSLATFANQLYVSLMSFYNKIIDDIHYIINNSLNPLEEINILGFECKIGKIEFQKHDNHGDIQFKCTSSKLQHILGKIRNLRKIEDAHLQLQKYIETYNYLENLYDPVFKERCRVEYIFEQDID